MKTQTRRTLWTIIALVAVLAYAGVLVHRSLLKPWTIMGAVTVQDADTRKQLPIANVEITPANSLEIAPGKTDQTGFFKIKLSKNVKKGTLITLRFRHPDYRPLDIDEIANDKIFVVHLTPLSKSAEDNSG